jgi:pimeloyl-ACP methyl ester carboxylesterase
MIEKVLVKTGEIEFDVRISGQGRPFIWGHGLTSSMDGEDALDIFKWNDFSNKIRLIRYDARGHGGTAPSYLPDDYHWRCLAEDMTAIADALDMERYMAGGQSMGCATAIYAALKVPHRIEGLVLVTPPTAWEKREAMSGIYRKTAKTSALLGGKLLAKLAFRRLRNDLPDWLAGAPEDKIRSTTKGLAAMGRRTLSVIFQGAALTDLPPKDVIRSIHIPALILAWTGDSGHPVEIAAELNRLLPRSSLVVAKDFSDIEMWPRLMQAFISGIHS